MGEALTALSALLTSSEFSLAKQLYARIFKPFLL